MPYEDKGPKGDGTRREIVLNADISGFGSSRTITSAHHRLAKYYASPWLGGPPRSEKLLELVVHMYTEEEAETAQFVPSFRGRTARRVARKSGRPLVDVERVLDHLALHKFLVWSWGIPRKYTLPPIVPGAFELALMTPDLSTRNRWHKRFAELFEEIYETGFYRQYLLSSRPPIRYLPVGTVAGSLQSAWPSDYLEEILEPYDLFAVGHCQCRLAMRLVGRGCDKPTDNCLVFGPLAKPLIDRGMMRRIDRPEAVAIKRDAEEHGCVTWMLNTVDRRNGNGSCSCCGCCCHALRVVSEFNVPGMISRPHFMPVKTKELCNNCGKCARTCPMGAWQAGDIAPVFQSSRCIGCGLCSVHCPTRALRLDPVKTAGRPDPSYLHLLVKMLPGYFANVVSAWGRRIIR